MEKPFKGLFHFYGNNRMDVSEQKKNLLVSGRPGIGKTTLILQLSRSLENIGGFYTREIRVEGARTGFAIKTFDGGSGVLSRKGLKSPYRVGKYGVNLEDIDSIAVKSVRRALADDSISTIIIDEIARMELYSRSFRSMVVEALDSPKSLLATIQARDDPFLDSIRSRNDVRLFNLTRGNMDSVQDEIRHALKDMERTE